MIYLYICICIFHILNDFSILCIHNNYVIPKSKRYSNNNYCCISIGIFSIK